MKTREQVENLKKIWLENSKSFDLASVEGYEDYHDELSLFALEHTVKEPSGPLEPMPGFMGPIPPEILDAISGIFGGNSHNNHSSELLDKIAFQIIKEKLKEMGPAIDRPEAGYYFKKIGEVAYTKAYFILEGRTKVTKANCPCSTCTSQRAESEE